MTPIHKYTHTHTHTTVCIYMYMYLSMCASDTCVNVSMHEFICSHTHVPHIDFHCNTGGVALTCTYTACSVSGATNTSRVHSKSGWGIYNNRRSNTSKGWGIPKKGAAPIILDQQAVWIGQCSHSVQSSNIGSSLGCGHGL